MNFSSLNLGCGADPWGDVRLDVGFVTQTGTRSLLNLRADAHYLPFRDKSFSEVRCWHMLEHVTDPMRVVSEIRRVSVRAVLRFPVDDGFKRATLLALFNGSPLGILSAYRTRKRHAHLWIIHPDIGIVRKVGLFEHLFTYGRKSRWLGRFGPYVSKVLPVVWEWEIVL